MVNLFVYPRQTAPEWKKMLSAWLGQASLTRIAVIGNLGGLRSFLRREEILFDDLGSQWPDTLDSKTLYLGDYPQAGSDRIPQATGAHVALFLADRTAVPDLPGVYGTTDAAGGMMVKETFPMLLDHLDEDPRSQQTFLLTLGRALNLQALRDLSTWY
jgi:hypothetical protein